MSPKETKDLQDVLFEIGSEELPATNLADLFETAAAEGRENPLLEKWKQAFTANRLTFESADVWATPRRLVFHAAGVAAAQQKRDLLTRLLSKQEGFDSAGAPTEKLLTILKHRNLSIADTTVEEQNGKEFVFVRKAEPVRKTASVLPELLEAFVKTLSFPKNMKWDDSGVFFPRPIRSTFCLYGSEAVKFKIGKVRSSDKTWVFSRGKRAAFAVSDASSYFRVLKKQGVILDQDERKKTIQALLEKTAKAQHSKLYDDPFLMAEVNFLVENPQMLAAPFKEEFLKLPVEVLAVSMARKQRIFGLVDKDGKVQPKFLAILDGAPSEKDKKDISKNYENILHAKLQDSLFFYKEDMKAPLEKKRDELKSLIFLKGGGSMYDKSERLVRLVKEVAQPLGLTDVEKKDLERAARLSKADLLTQMVGEFPELQGVMGKYYGTASGEPTSVAFAIGEQYLPRTATDKLPVTKAGAILSMLDKVDLVTTCFSLNMEPTSSLDPYGLRRSASAVMRILVDHQLDFDFEKLLKDSESGSKVFPKVQAFFRDRFKAVLSSAYPGDLIDAAMGARFQSPAETARRVHELSRFSSKPAFVHACKVVERTHNILKGNKEQLPARPDKALFTEPLEHAVMEKLEKHGAGIAGARKEGDLERVTSLYAEAFFDILNQFFDKVFINAEDLNVRKNRLSLLKAIKSLYTDDIADLSKIQVSSGATSPSNPSKREKK